MLREALFLKQWIYSQIAIKNSFYDKESYFMLDRFYCNYFPYICKCIMYVIDIMHMPSPPLPHPTYT